jgi:hypothetical protein
MAEDGNSTGDPTETIESLERKKKLLKEIEEINLQTTKQAEQQIKAEKRIEDKLRSKLSALRELEASTEKLSDKQKESLETLERELELQEDKIELLEEEAETIGNLKELATDLVGLTGFGKLPKLMGLVKDPLKTIKLGFVQIKEVVSEIGTSGALFSIAAGMATATLAAVKEFDSIQASINKATGAAGSLNDVLFEVGDKYRDFGIGFEQASVAVLGLQNSVSDFRDINKSAQIELTAMAAKLELLGISSETTGGIFQDFQKGMGLMQSEAMEATEQIAGMAISLGIPPQKMAEGFKSAMPDLASFGTSAVKIFGNLTAASKKLGIEMGSLIGFAKQFDTFEGAAEGAAKLNAILGTQLNSVQLLNAEYDDRIEIILESVEASGKQWSAMSRFERMAVANAAGISDMAEANNLFGRGLAAFREGQREMENLSYTQEELEEAMKASTDVMTKLKQLFFQLAITVQPLAETLSVAITKLTKFIAENKDLLKLIFTTIVALKGVTLGLNLLTKGILALRTANAVGFFGTLAGVTKKLASPLLSTWEGLKKVDGALRGTTTAAEKSAGPLSKFGDWLKGLKGKTGDPVTKGLNDTADGMKKAGNNAGKSWKNILAFGAAVLFVGVGIGVAASGVAQLAEAFANPSWGQLGAVVLVLGLFAAGIYALGAASFTAGPPILFFAGAVALIGAGIGLAAAGIGYMAERLGMLGENIGPVVQAIAGLTFAVGAFSFMMTNPLSLLGLATFAASLGGIIAALNNVPEEKTVALNTTLDSFDKIGKSGTDITGTIDGIKGAVEAYVSIKDTPDEEIHKKFLEVINAIKRGKTEQAAPAPANRSGRAGGQPIPIVLQMDGWTFANGVLPAGLEDYFKQ